MADKGFIMGHISIKSTEFTKVLNPAYLIVAGNQIDAKKFTGLG